MNHVKNRWARVVLVLLADAIAAAHAVAETNEVAAFETGHSLPGVSLLPVLGNLILVLGLVVAGGWLLARLRLPGRGRDHNLRVIASQSVGSKEKIMIVEVGEQQLVVGMTPSSINTLFVPSGPLLADMAGESVDSRSFAARLRESLQRARQ